MSTYTSARFFLGANTPGGFYGYHETDLYDPRDGWAAFLIKSGAGTGKATFMRRVLQELTDMGLEAETVYCSSDPQSLDAVLFPAVKLCVIDATSPHIIEPYAYGECEQLVPFGCCLQAEKTLSQTVPWFEAADACAGAHARCCRFLAAAHSLLENNRRIADTAVLHDKLIAAATRLAVRECGKGADRCGTMTRRFLSAVTPQGLIQFTDTATALCPKLYVLNDEYGAVSGVFMSVLCDCALEAGCHVIACHSPLFPKEAPVHLLIPSLGVGFLTADSLQPIDIPVFRRIHAARFMQGDILRTKKQQLNFNHRAAADLLGEAVKASADAKAHHDRMERLHIAAMDWDCWQKLADNAMQQIKHIAQDRL